jgi:hypothetical protein
LECQHRDTHEHTCISRRNSRSDPSLGSLRQLLRVSHALGSPSMELILNALDLSLCRDRSRPPGSNLWLPTLYLCNDTHYRLQLCRCATNTYATGIKTPCPSPAPLQPMPQICLPSASISAFRSTRGESYNQLRVRAISGTHQRECTHRHQKYGTSWDAKL